MPQYLNTLESLRNSTSQCVNDTHSQIFLKYPHENEDQPIYDDDGSSLDERIE